MLSSIPNPNTQYQNTMHLFVNPNQLDPEKDKDVIKIVTISDTHSKHSQIRNIPSGDILLHGGDFTNTGSLRDIKSYDKWIGDLITKKKKFKYSVLIAGIPYIHYYSILTKII